MYMSLPMSYEVIKMAGKKKILVLPGSYRRQAFSRSIANYAASVFSDDCEVEFAVLDELPLFNQDRDDDGETPESWKKFRRQVAESDGVLIVTPEYNRSFPAVLKNAIDIASRPAGQSVWSGKPTAIISTSPGAQGGALANQQLRQPLMLLGVKIMLQPEIYISNVDSLLDETGRLDNESTQKFLTKAMAGFEDFISAC